jgi:hypothetical protein
MERPKKSVTSPSPGEKALVISMSPEGEPLEKICAQNDSARKPSADQYTRSSSTDFWSKT